MRGRIFSEGKLICRVEPQVASIMKLLCVVIVVDTFSCEIETKLELIDEGVPSK